MRRPKRWTEAWALRQSLARFAKIEHLLEEIAGLWGDEIQHLVDEADELRGLIRGKAIEWPKSIEEIMDERRQRDL